jgi:single-stranded-DNA-specific exonuclease
MIPSRARWKIGQADEATVNELSVRLGVDPLVARLLAARGWSDPEAAARFLGGDEQSLHDPYLLDGMDAAVRRIRQALDGGEKLRIYGDYDADGFSSTALMSRLFTSLGANFDAYIPHRVTEGYGLNRQAIKLAAEAGVKLLVTVDTGISAREEIAYAAELGMDVIVTDHHEPPAELPDAVALVNPKKPGCPYPYKGLAGAGVAFKLAQALLGRIPVELADIAAIGTVGDLMPLDGENRTLVKLGLGRMRSGSYAGVKALFEVAGVNRSTVNAGHLAFTLAPRINASGRLEAADPALRLLVTDDPVEADQLAMNLDLLNRERQRIVDEIASEAVELAGAQAESEGVLVVAKEGWNVGVIGIVAAKLLERYYRPTVVLSIDPATGLAKGSARSIAGFDLYEALTECADLLDHYGGHQAAAGMTIAAANLSAFRERLGQIARERLSVEDYQPILAADAECGLDQASLGLIRELDQLAPFGAGNPSPRFLFRALRILDQRTMGKDNRHLKLQVVPWTPQGVQKPTAIDAVGFGRGSLLDRLSATDRLELVGELTLNEWNGKMKPQILIQDLRVPGLQVFDYRGAAGDDRRWVSLAKDAAGVGVVLFSPEPLDRVPEPLRTCSLWLYEPERGVRPLRAAWEQAPEAGSLQSACRFEELTGLVLLTLPPSRSALQAVLQQAEQVHRLYPVLASPSESAAMPNREMFKQIYATLRREGSARPGGIEPLSFLSRRAGVPAPTVRFILEVFEELALVEQASGDYRCTAAPAKRDLAESIRYREREQLRAVEEELLFSSASDLTRLLRELREQR